MRIAVIGWGSLIWCPGSLKIQGRWRREGPRLPIEFARISRGHRLTLVLHEGVSEQSTFWARSAEVKLEDAATNLRIREATDDESIHFFRKGSTPKGLGRVAIAEWLEGKADLDAALWTGLPSNWEEPGKRGRPFSIDDAIAYLKELCQKRRSANAEEYIRNAPDSIRTEFRARAEGELGWTPNSLVLTLFEEA